MNHLNHITRFELERLLAEELSAAGADVVAAHLDTCHPCRSALDDLQAQQRAFVAEVPYGAFRIEHQRRLAARASKRRWLPSSLVATGVLAASAAMVLLTLQPPAGDDAATRTKGSSVALTFSVLEDGVLRPGISGETLAPHTRLQLSYQAGSMTHMALIGIDAGGGITVYFPEATASTLAPVPDGPTGRLPFSLSLDDAAGWERFVAVFSASPAPLGDVVTAAREVSASADAPLPLGPSYAHTEVRIVKTGATPGARTRDSAH